MDNVTISLAMTKLGDKLEELEELQVHARVLTAEIRQLMLDWLDTLNPYCNHGRLLSGYCPACKKVNQLDDITNDDNPSDLEIKE